VAPHRGWIDKSSKEHYWALPAKKIKDLSEPAAASAEAAPGSHTVEESFDPFEEGDSLERFLDTLMVDELDLKKDDYVLEQEIDPVQSVLESPTRHVPTQYTIYPLDVWVHPDCREKLRQKVNGRWYTCADALKLPDLSQTAAKVFELVLQREQELKEKYARDPKLKNRPDAQRLLLDAVAEQPTMEGLARKWLSRNRRGVRCLRKDQLDQILDVGNRAFNLRVADPYLRYQMQGVGFTWSFFTEKDPQDLHVHGAPVVEVYGVLEGALDVWWKAYHDRGTSAWSHRTLHPGDWLEVDSLQCHIVHWRGNGKAVVFKAGSGPLAEVGRLGVKGKTQCADDDGKPCHCMKPPAVEQLIRKK
jgi:hypothetical protein